MILLSKHSTRAAFGDFILAGREKARLRQIDVCERAGITQAHYSLIERGEREVTLSVALNICDALDLNINDFVNKMST